MPRKRAHSEKTPNNAQQPKYSISVAAALSGVPEQQLRRMEENGLVAPLRTEGNTRRYSDADLEQISEVSTLADTGVNMAGIHQIVELRREVCQLKREVETLRRLIAREQGADALPDMDAREG